MPIIPVALPAGLYKNGTPYSRKVRWTDGNLIRWHDGAIRPIGGWARRRANGIEINSLIADPTLAAIRDGYSWRSNNQSQHVVFGSNLALKHVAENGTITDITYAGYTASNASKDVVYSTGYGVGAYSVGPYGVSLITESDDFEAPNRWYMTNFGELLITGSRSNGGMYEVDPSTLTPVAVTNAPSNVQAAIVTEERQVMAIGGGGEPRRVQTSEIEDRTDWTPGVANQSIDRTLRGTGKLLNLFNVLDHVLILGETDAHAAKYINAPYVYSIDMVGEKCGPVCAEAATATDRFVFWLGERSFWLYDGAVKVLPCEVMDFLISDMDPYQKQKISCFTNTTFNEVWWLYQSKSTTTTEVDSYVVFNYAMQTWNTGRIDRTTGIDRGVTTTPIYVDHDGYVYNHEQLDALPTGTIFVESGAIDISNGENNVAVRQIFPDTESTQDVTLSLIARQFPNDTEYTYGPYTYNNPIPTRALGRSIKVHATFNQLYSELGVLRLDIAPSGTGKR